MDNTDYMDNEKYIGIFNNNTLNYLYDTSLICISYFWKWLQFFVSNFVTTSDQSNENNGKSEILLHFLLLASKMVFYLIITLLIGLPLLLLALPVWVILHIFKERPFRTFENKEILQKNAKNLFQQNDFKISVLSTNCCLLNEVAARVNNLSNNTKRAKKIGDRLISCQEKHIYVKTENLALFNETLESVDRLEKPPIFQSYVPSETDFILLQEVFDRKSAQNLVKKLKNRYPHIIYDIGPSFGKDLGRNRAFISLENSGLFFASKYPIQKTIFKTYKNAIWGDRFAGKGCLINILKISENGPKNDPIYAIITNTHMQAQEGDECSEIRKNQLIYARKEMDLAEKNFLAENINLPKNCIKFKIMAGDFNFDLDSHEIEKQIFDENAFEHNFFDFIDVFDFKKQNLKKIGTILDHKNMHKYKSSKNLINAVNDGCYEIQKMLHNSNNCLSEEDLMEDKETEKINVFYKDPSRAPVLKLDHIWIHPENAYTVEVKYIGAFVGLTDHVSIFGKFGVK